MCAQIIQKFTLRAIGVLGKKRIGAVGMSQQSRSTTPPSAAMVGLGGLEPPASPLSGARSNHLSYRPNVFMPSGGACRDRTDDPLLAKQVLSQLS